MRAVRRILTKERVIFSLEDLRAEQGVDRQGQYIGILEPGLDQTLLPRKAL